MKKVLLFSVLLVLGLAGSQMLPTWLGDLNESFSYGVRLLTMVGLSFIMIRVGFEFDIDKNNLKQYGHDYLAAFSAATLPWIFVTLYFVFVLLPSETWGSVIAWEETLLTGRFAAPTSAGVLFSMLAAAGLSTTWLFHKARVLAIFDDLDTVLLLIPLQMLMVGLAWQLGIVVFVLVALLAVGYIFLHKVRLPGSWPWLLIYATAITATTDIIYRASKVIDPEVPIHLEVLLPAFVLGCLVANPHKYLHGKGEETAGTVVAAIFMIVVGLSMPAILDVKVPTSPDAELNERLTALQPMMDWGEIAFHVLIVTLLSNLGKMLVAVFYKTEATRRERLALAIGMWPRGEVGAGVLAMSIGYGIGGPVLTIAMLSLALNLLLTGAFIIAVKKITEKIPGYQPQIHSQN